MITFTFQDTAFQRDFKERIEKTKNPAGMLKVVGRELANQLKRYYQRKDTTSANSLSDRRSHFWLAVSRTVQNPELAGTSSVSVSITHPAIAQKVFGGTITAKRAGFLTIPVEEQAYGRTAATFEHETGLKLFLVVTGKGEFQHAVLAVKAGGGIQVEYVLKHSVTQSADSTALPPKSFLEAAIISRADKYIAREVAKP